MGFATSITTAVLFLSILIIATSVYPVLFDSYRTIQESLDDKHRIRVDQLNTEVNITSIDDLTPDTITITISNQGTTVLNASRSSVVVDGIYKTYSASPDGYWMPLKNALFTVDAITSTDHQVIVITENGISDIGTYHS